MVLDEIETFILTHDDPGVTIAEVAAAFDDLDRDKAKYRMEKLEQQDRVYKKVTGASAAIWFPKA
jgi:hypothetical protein